MIPFARRWGLLWGSVALLLLSSLPGCRIDAQTGKGAASIVGAGIVNDPKNKSLRFEMLEFGLHEFCKELLVSGAPLRLDDEQPIIGRFFAESCQAASVADREQDRILVQFGGRGYAWTLGTGRLGFRARGLLELSPDFRLYEGAMYVYFRPVKVDTSDFEILMSERKLTQAAISVAGLDEQELGRAIIDAQLGRGFTVVRYDADGHTDFALGLVAEGDTPFRPYQVVTSPRRTAGNGRTELFVGQQDYLGRLHVGPGQAITLTLKLEGTPHIDVLVLPANGGQPIREYVQHPGPRVPRERAPFSAELTSRAPLRAEIPVSAGDYYVLFDHSASAGRVTPDEKALPARVDYLVQLGRATPR